MTRKLCPDCPVGAAHLVHGKRARVICCRIAANVQTTFGVDPSADDRSAMAAEMKERVRETWERLQYEAIYGQRSGKTAFMEENLRRANERGWAFWHFGSDGRVMRNARVVSVRDVGPYQPDPKCEVLP